MIIETMKQAVDALETLGCGDSYKTHNAASALRRAIKRVENPDTDWNGWLKRDVYFEDGEALMHSEPEWIGLTDEEIKQCIDSRGGFVEDFARAIEAKLKEKNT